jgi:CHAT domain/Tetratricopeptide repeat
MRCVRQLRRLCALGSAGVVIFLGLHAKGGDAALMRPTFDYKESKSYTELTNSIQEIKHRVDLAQRTLGNGSTNVADLLSDLAGLYDDLGDYAQALFLYQRCLTIREELLGPSHMAVADASNDLAWEYRQIGDYDRALPLFERSLAVTEKLVGSEHHDFATTLDSLAETKTISYYVTSGREVARLVESGSKNTANASLVMGNPDFDMDLNGGGGLVVTGSHGASLHEEARSPGLEIGDFKSQTGLSNVASATRSISRSYRGMKFTRLPGSEAEARSVAKLLGGDSVLRLGAEAREAELKSVVSLRVLHLATHGFFLSDQEFKHTNSLEELFSRSNLPGGRQENDWLNPMVRCGIALAGANHALQITNAVAEDGLLTGLEASLLNLQGTELVILSACDTGTGEVKIGEGVMSLRRAFRIAGAQTVLASHSTVSDKATRHLRCGLSHLLVECIHGQDDCKYHGAELGGHRTGRHRGNGQTASSRADRRTGGHWRHRFLSKTFADPATRFAADWRTACLDDVEPAGNSTALFSG